MSIYHLFIFPNSYRHNNTSFKIQHKQEFEYYYFILKIIRKRNNALTLHVASTTNLWLCKDNCELFCFISISWSTILRFLLQLWTGKWSIKDEHKLLSELGGTAAGSNGGSPYYDTSTGTFSAPTTSADLYESISTMSQAQANSHLYNSSIGTTIGESTL